MPGSVFPASAGYPQYSGTPLIPPHFSTNVLDRFYHETLFREISTVGPYQELRGKGDTVVVPIEPKVYVEAGSKDGGIKYQTLDVSSITLTLDQILQFGVKIDNIDRAMQAFDMFGSAERSAAQSMAETMDSTILSYLYTQVDPANAGSNAGALSGNINLGATGAPVVISNGDDLRRLLARLQRTLLEQAAPESDVYVLLPYEARQLIGTASEFLMIGAQGGFDPSIAERGVMMREIYGMKAYVSARLPKLIDPITNLPVTYIIAGVPRALAYASVLDEMKVIDNDRDDPFSTFLAGRMAYGFGVVYPELLATAYVNFDPAGL